MATTVVRFGVVTDVQYGDKEADPLKAYKNFKGAYGWLKEAVEGFNTDSDLDFTIQLGDVIDGTEGKDHAQDVSDLEKATGLLGSLQHPHHNVIGNHCLSLPRPILYKELKMPGPYYSFVVKDWRFIVIDSQDMATTWPEGTANHKQAREWLAANQHRPNAVEWNGGITQVQFDWLESELQAAAATRQKVVVFGHIPAAPGSSHERHLTYNGDELVSLLSRHPHCVAYFCGHYHKGGYACVSLPSGGVCHYVTVEGVLETGDKPCHGFVTLHSDRIEVEGRGTMSSRVLPFRDPYAEEVQ